MQNDDKSSSNNEKTAKVKAIKHLANVLIAKEIAYVEMKKTKLRLTHKNKFTTQGTETITPSVFTIIYTMSAM